MFKVKLVIFKLFFSTRVGLIFPQGDGLRIFLETVMSNIQNQTQSNAPTHYDLIVQGCGFLNRLREVESKKSKYYAATLSANRGDQGERTSFEVRIVGSDAKKLFAGLLDQFPAVLDKDFKKRPSVFCAFSVGDIQPKSYTGKDGKEVLYIDGRLLRFLFINVNGKPWYSKNNPNLLPVEGLSSSTAKADDEQPVAKAA